MEADPHAETPSPDEAFPVSAEWKAQIEHRCRELDENAVELISGDPVFDEVTKALG